MSKISQLIDHTLLAPTATATQIDTLVQEAVEHGFKTVCVNPAWVSRARRAVEGTPVGVCTVVGFPLGASTTAVKVFETTDAVTNGAHEVDMVINIGWALAGQWDDIEAEIRAVVDAAGSQALVKVILETCLLTAEQTAEASRRSVAAGADFVKTSTGFSKHGATVEAVQLMRETVGPDLGVKASGGVRTPEDLARMVEAGASRIGASAGAAILAGSTI
ncbi:deoxyribose-phosphate aldolase [Arthrobacter sp. zg-Y859]|uniref:Deoxyribose-phosphate aldolase n=1 Tax=Arthrobacter jinronghuae TaxID=2964609 RepID=A0ABT1NUU6_9MICC|nr:deoxyribose-phosphate aldolase [Arthrobacter jinronghuae]MCQ1950877.1 deoxyribose-phosphate aldolase [Arthrobacter jinronghuae]MCQ1957066.1 deoxyribose-phosphate aldolase [Arthrobacter jinronghuae]UWX79345.1 deoxyribose-phosphate aldolase [Arthrobacter jinronghuae]